MLTNITQLRELDPEVWYAGSARVVQLALQPNASRERPPCNLCWIFYRGIYYYSTNPERPLVRLKMSKSHNLPLVSCCDRRSYERFVKEAEEGKYGDHEMVTDCDLGDF